MHRIVNLTIGWVSGSTTSTQRERWRRKARHPLPNRLIVLHYFMHERYIITNYILCEYGPALSHTYAPVDHFDLFQASSSSTRTSIHYHCLSWICAIHFPHLHTRIPTPNIQLIRHSIRIHRMPSDGNRLPVLLKMCSAHIQVQIKIFFSINKWSVI